jgi:hypothetical protein
LGLDYRELSSLGPLDVTRRIVEMACGPRSNSTIEDGEERYVAAEVAEWILERDDGGAPPTPDEIVRETIAIIISEVVETEVGEMLRTDERPEWASQLAEGQIREAAEILAGRAQLTASGVTHADFARSIEDGIETLRRILGGRA